MTLKLGMCPKCGNVVNLNDIEEIDDDTVIGCGLVSNDLIRCTDCLCNYGDDACKEIRLDCGLLRTTAEEYMEANL